MSIGDFQVNMATKDELGTLYEGLKSLKVQASPVTTFTQGLSKIPTGGYSYSDKPVDDGERCKITLEEPFNKLYKPVEMYSKSNNSYFKLADHIAKPMAGNGYLLFFIDEESPIPIHPTEKIVKSFLATEETVEGIQIDEMPRIISSTPVYRIKMYITRIAKENLQDELEAVNKLLQEA